MMLPSRHRKTAGQTPRQSYNKPQQRHASGNPTCKHVPWRSSRATSAHSRHRRRQRPGPGWHDAHRARLTTPRAISRHRAHLSSGQPSIHQERASSFTPIGHATPPHPPGCCLHSSSTRAPSATVPVFISSHLSPPRSFAFVLGGVQPQGLLAKCWRSPPSQSSRVSCRLLQPRYGGMRAHARRKLPTTQHHMPAGCVSGVLVMLPPREACRHCRQRGQARLAASCRQDGVVGETVACRATFWRSPS